MVEELFKEQANGINITIASRYQSTAVFTISSNEGTAFQTPLRFSKPTQLGLFEEAFI